MKLMSIRAITTMALLGFLSFSPILAQDDANADNNASANASEESPEYLISAGPKLGATTTKFVGSDPYLAVWDNSTGVTGGAFVKYDVKDWLAFQVELMYHKKGINSSEPSTQNRASYWHLHYFQLPLLAKFQYRFNDFFPFVAIGPNFGYMITNQADGLVGGTEYNEDKIQSPFNNGIPNHIDDINEWDIGAVFAAGLDMEFGRFFVGAEYRYDLGFMSVAEGVNDGDLDMKNRASSFLVSLGINFSSSRDE